MSAKWTKTLPIGLAAACLIAAVVAGGGLAPLHGSPAPAGSDPAVHKFVVEVGGMAPTGFLSVSGMESAVEVIEFRNGNERGSRKIPGRNRTGNIVLRGTVAAAREFWPWYQNALDGNVQERDIVITVLDQGNNPVVRYQIANAWPCAWRAPVLDALASEVAVEEIELAAGRFQREAVQ